MPKKRRTKKILPKKKRTKVKIASKREKKKVKRTKGNGTITRKRVRKSEGKPTKAQIAKAKKILKLAKIKIPTFRQSKKQKELSKRAKKGWKTRKKKERESFQWLTKEDKKRYRLLKAENKSMEKEDSSFFKRELYKIADEENVTTSEVYTWCLYNGFSRASLIW
jgi:hypothetical protein